MKLLSAKRLAEELSVSERHVRQMIAEGRWPIYRVGKNRVRLIMTKSSNFAVSPLKEFYLSTKERTFRSDHHLDLTLDRASGGRKHVS